MHTTPDTAVYALTPQGAALGKTLADALGAVLFLPAALAAREGGIAFSSLSKLLGENFSLYRRHVFVSAVGIAVRCIAPHIKSKASDPAVVALDQQGRFVVSVISGHIGGANALAQEVAAITGGAAVITTATDTEGLPSLDALAQEKGLIIHNLKAGTAVSAALLAGVPVDLYDPYNRLGLAGSHWERHFHFLTASPDKDPEQLDPTVPLVEVTCAGRAGNERHLVLHPQALHVGVGCRRGVNAQALADFIQGTLEEAGFSASSLASLASVTLKKDEEGLLAAAAWLGVPIQFYTPEELSTVPVSEPSAKVREVLGIDGVCEAAALLAAGHNAILHLPKQKGEGMTLALAESIPHD